jgi:hypothetical protein
MKPFESTCIATSVQLVFLPLSVRFWTDTETEILQAVGEVSVGFADALNADECAAVRRAFATDRVSRWVVLGCWCGVAGLSIAMAVAERGRH